MKDTRPGDPLLGTMVGNYRIESILGTGGMGTVYQARQEQIGKEVAIKVLRPEVSESVEAVQRFFNEARAANAVANEHILDIIDFGQTADGRSCMIMERLEGITLHSLLTVGHLTSESHLLFLAAQIAEALGAAHERGIIHRDLKPENVFLIKRGGSEDFVKIVDFGIAKLMDPQLSGPVHTLSGSVLGTPHYMSPEQCAGDPIGPGTDIYSLGVILFEMATGKVPFHATTYAGILSKHIVEPPPDPRAVAEHVSVALSAIVLRCLQKTAEARYATMGALLDALLALLETHGGYRPRGSGATPFPVRRVGGGAPGRTPAAGSTTLSMGATLAPAPTVPPAPRRGWLAVAAGVLVLLLGAGVAAWMYVRDESATGEDRTAERSEKTKKAVAPPAARTVRVESAPPRAEVWRDGTRLGDSPVDVEVGSAKGDEAEVELRLPGYETRRVTLDRDTVSPLALTLKPVAVAPATAGSADTKTAGTAKGAPKKRKGPASAGPTLF